MKFFALVFLAAAFAGCDVRSGTAIKEMEKFEAKPTPAFSPLPSPTPIDPAESVSVDISQESETVHFNGYKEKKTESCKKFDRLIINGDDNEIAIKGVCRQIMINGDRNKISSEAALEFVFNGSENTLTHTLFVNGEPPTVLQNKAGNIVEKLSSSRKNTGASRNSRSK